jgi:hypothetical protein
VTKELVLAALIAVYCIENITNIFPQFNRAITNIKFIAIL